ncbi:hypothetical protein PROFUN_15400 [Planoprotostelium fungivorum]|uniref:Uncharacterized protein n=1 Tax=Planoprotostelium fungivorum TaxID=1890364 RepID=A0A2P6MVF2_9EUKA|nr:hypothetical protein PROFUN_15400 [Planoprotostelium fungivorum]
MRQWIYFSGTWIEITDCSGGPPLHIRWAQLERESWMKIQWPSYDIPARFEMLQQSQKILLVSGRHVTSLCQQSLNVFAFLPLYSWCVVLRRRQSPRQSQDETVSAGPYPVLALLQNSKSRDRSRNDTQGLSMITSTGTYTQV